MSIEKHLSDLTFAVQTLTAAFTQYTGSQPVQVVEAPKAQQAVVGSAIDEEEVGSTTENKIAGKKTYIFMKNEKKGFIVQKGELLPIMDEHTVSVGKTKWDELCKKYGLDPETGDDPARKAAKEAIRNEKVVSDDLDDDLEETVTEQASDELEDDLEETVTEQVSDELEDDLDLDDEPEAVDPVQVLRDKLIEVVKKTGQKELVRKIFAKLEVQNTDQLTADHVERGLKICEAAITKYGK